MARPPKPIDWDLVERKMQAGCKATEICWDFGINKDTFSDRFKAEYGVYFSEYSANLHNVGKGNVRHQQYERAMDGNTQMLTILGREWLGQEQDKDNKTTAPNSEILHRDQRIAFLEEQLRQKTNAEQPKTESELLTSDPQI
jgi:hypothetical protein